MSYFLDTNCFRVLEGYYPSRFPSFWSAFDDAVEAGRIASVREVRKEIERGSTPSFIDQWVADNERFFRDPGEAELWSLTEIFRIPHFQGLVSPKSILTGTPVADPFLVAAAMAIGGTVVTEERAKPHSAKIPTVCDHFGVGCTNLEGMLTALDWRF